jgi:hypothetical protein
MWAARGWLGGIVGRPRSVPETMPDAFGALKFLSEQPGIDVGRIGIMGFSWGGAVTMLRATEPCSSRYANGALKFAAHVAHYPVCWVYNQVSGYDFNEFTGSPLLIQLESSIVTMRLIPVNNCLNRYRYRRSFSFRYAFIGMYIMLGTGYSRL